jgi:O-acetyl-ADP-ribose deacetylase (regulator of RNase III)
MLDVSEVTKQLRKIIQDNSDLQDIWTYGKISEVWPTHNGTLNFTLTDSGEEIECVIFNDRRPLQENLPPVGNNVLVKGQIYVYETVSEYRFRVTDINLSEGSSPSPLSSINDLTTTLNSNLTDHPTVKVQGQIAKVFVTPADYTILKLKDVTANGQSDAIIECVIPPDIDPPFPLQIEKKVQVTGKFGIFSKASAYRIEVGDENNITQVTERSTQVQTTPNECQKCGLRCEGSYQLCSICHYAQIEHEGVVVGAVMRYLERFSNFSTQREYEVRFGVNIIGRADVALLNSEGNPVAIAECKKIGYDGSDGIVQLEGYINPTVARLGLFADNTDPYEWTFLKKNDERQRFDPITRPQFERELGVEPTPEIPSTKTQLELVQGNIIESEVDAIVNAADPNLTRGIGLDGAIRDAGGEEIERECQEIFDREGVCPPGKAVITTGGNLPARYVIHAVGPIWQGGNRSEPESLADCYRSSLQLAAEKGIQSIAFPAISTGNFGFPIERAAHVALTTVKEFVEQAHQNNEMVPERIQFVLFDEEAYACYVNAFSTLGLGLFSLIG